MKQTQSSGLVTAYTYDAANRVLSMMDNQDLSQRYTYDVLGNRLIAQTTGDKIITYTYDENGNRISSSIPDGDTEYVYDTFNRLTMIKNRLGVLLSDLWIDR